MFIRASGRNANIPLPLTKLDALIVLETVQLRHWSSVCAILRLHLRDSNNSVVTGINTRNTSEGPLSSLCVVVANKNQEYRLQQLDVG